MSLQLANTKAIPTVDQTAVAACGKRVAHEGTRAEGFV